MVTDDPEKVLKAWLSRYGKLAGITRVENESGYWIVRLGWTGKIPAFQKIFSDHGCGDQKRSLSAAIQVRNMAFLELYKEGTISGAPGKRTRPLMTRQNKTGIPGMTLQRLESKAGAGVFYSWKVNWKEGGKVKGRSFAWSSYANTETDGGLESFKVAALCRMEADLRTYGCSDIDPGEESLEALGLKALHCYGYFPISAHSKA